MAQEYSEAEAIAAVQRGEREAFRCLVAKHQDRVFATIMRMVRRRDTAEELTQETFLRAYRSISSFRGESTFGTWLTRIAINRTNSYFRSREHSQEKRSVAFDASVHGGSSNSVSHEVAEKERLSVFRDCFLQLASHFQELIELCSFQGESYEYAAALQQVPIGTVRSRLNSARVQLKECMERKLGESL